MHSIYDDILFWQHWIFLVLFACGASANKSKGRKRWKKTKQNSPLTDFLAQSDCSKFGKDWFLKTLLTTGTCWCLDQSLPCWEPPGRCGRGWAETHPWKVFPRRIPLLGKEEVCKGGRKDTKRQRDTEGKTKKTFYLIITEDNTADRDFIILRKQLSPKFAKISATSLLESAYCCEVLALHFPPTCCQTASVMMWHFS